MRALFVSLLFLGGCVTTPGPVSSAAFPSLVAAAVADPILVSGPGSWTPNSRRVVEFANTGGAVSTPHYRDGVTVITQHGVSFLEWDGGAHAYVVTKRLAREEVTASLASLGVSCVLIVQENRDAAFHRFEFVRAGGLANDCATARNALAALAQNGQPAPTS